MTITFSPAVGSIRVSVFAGGADASWSPRSARCPGLAGTLKAKLGKATRIRVSAGYVGSGDKPVTVTTTLKR